MPVQKITTQYEIDSSDLDKLNAKFDGAIKKQQELAKQADQTGQQFTKAEKPVREWGAKAETAGKKATDSLKQTGNQAGLLGNSFKSLGGILAGVFVVDRILEYGKSIVQLGVQFESLKTAIDFSSGSVEAGAVNMAFLADVSKRLGLDLMGATKGFQQILAAATGAGLSGNQTREIFEGVATAARVMGKSAADQEGIFLALSQMLSKGTVQAEELRGQIGERLPGAFNLAAKSIGVTTMELNKMLEQGQVLSADFVPKFAATLKEEFEKGIPKSMETTGAALVELGNNYDRVLKNISESNGGFINTIIRQSSGFMGMLADIFEDEDNKIIQRRLAGTGRFKEAISKEFKDIANEARANGGNVASAVDQASKGYTDRLKGQIAFFQKEFDSIKGGFNIFDGDQRAMGLFTNVQYTEEITKRAATLERLRAELKAVGQVQSDVLAGVNPDGPSKEPSKGTIELLELAIKNLNAQKKGTVDLTQAQANQYNQTIKFYQDLLDKLNGVEKKGGAKKKGPKESPLALPSFGDIEVPEEPWDILFKHYDDAEKKATDTAEKALDYYNKMFGIEMPEVVDKFTEAELAAMDERRKYFEEQEQAKLEYRKAVEEEALNFAITSAGAYMDFRAQQIDDELGMLSAMREADLVLAGDNEQAKHDIELQYAEKERELRRKQAVNDRNQALFNIATNTAMGIMSVLSTGGGTRYADFGISAGILTALVAATGAVQAGMVLARPLPQFYKGTDSSPEGFAWVGERGSEGKITPDGRFSLIPGGAHVDYLERGTKIIPNHRLADFMDRETVHPALSISDSKVSGIDIKGLGAEIGRNITLQQQTFDERGFRTYTVKQNQRIQRLNSKNRFNRA